MLRSVFLSQPNALAIRLNSPVMDVSDTVRLSVFIVTKIPFLINGCDGFGLYIAGWTAFNDSTGILHFVDGFWIILDGHTMSNPLSSQQVNGINHVIANTCLTGMDRDIVPKRSGISSFSKTGT